MITLEEIKNIVTPDESRVLELKKTTGELKEAMHTACAFLNTDGGWLFFGIAPTSLKVMGQQVTDNTQRELAQAFSHFYPALDVHVEYVDVPDHQGNKVIAMHFDGWVWGKEPYTYHGCPYYKVESTTKEMPREMFEERLQAAKPHQFGWEKQIAEGFKASDMDEEHIRAAVRLGIESGRISPSANGESIEALLGKFNLKKEGQLTNAAVMLFAKDTSDYPQLLLRMARFMGMDKDEFIDNQRQQGNFFDLLDAGMMFLYKHLNISGKIVGLHRIDKLEIPIAALREALINALSHRTYDQPGASTSLAVYDDRVEIVNPGRLPKELTVETMMQPHDSHPMNPDIASVLFKTTYLESWGSGVKRIVSACQEANVPLPHYELRPGGIAIVFPRPKKNGGINGGKDGGKDGGDVALIELTIIQKDIIDLIRADKTISIDQMAVKMAVKKRTLEREIANLKQKEYISRIGSPRWGQWEVNIPLDCIIEIV